MVNTNNTTNNNTPALYIGTYGKYAAGSIDGAWVDMTEFDNADEFFDYCKELHSNEENPEFMAQDFENMPKNLYSEAIDNENIEQIIEYAHLTDEEKEIIKAFDDCRGYNGEDIKGILEECYYCSYNSEEDFIDNQTEEYISAYTTANTRDAVEAMSRYFNREQFARDLRFDFIGCYNDDYSRYIVFWNN